MKGGMPIVGEGGSVEQWPSCLTNQPCMDTQNTLEHRTNTNNNLEIQYLSSQMFSFNLRIVPSRCSNLTSVKRGKC